MEGLWVGKGQQQQNVGMFLSEMCKKHVTPFSVR